MGNNNYGYVLNKSQIQSQLLNRGAYKSALDQLGRQASTEAGQAFQQYGDTVEAAYATSLQNKNLVSASPMFSGYKRELESDIDTQLDQIYKQASAAYQQNLSTIAEQYAKGASEVVSDATKQTDLANKYWQAHLDYYDKYLREELPNSNLMGVTLSEMIKRAKSGDISPYENYIQNWFTEDENGPRMKTIDELLVGMTEKDAEGKLIFNEDTVKFLQMLEDYDESEILSKAVGSEYKSFSDWLRENDYDTYEWSLTDQGKGFGSGFDLFRELADMPENLHFRSYQSFAEMPENKQRSFIEENKDDLIKSMVPYVNWEISDNQGGDSPRLSSYLAGIDDKGFKDYITERLKEDYYKNAKNPEEGVWFPSIRYSNIKGSLNKSNKEMQEYINQLGYEYYKDKQIDDLAKRLYGNYSESDLEFLKKELGL